MAYDVVTVTVNNRPPIGYYGEYSDYLIEAEDNIIIQMRAKGIIYDFKKIPYKYGQYGEDNAYTDFIFLLLSKNGPYEDYESAKLIFDIM